MNYKYFEGICQNEHYCEEYVLEEGVYFILCDYCQSPILNWKEIDSEHINLDLTEKLEFIYENNNKNTKVDLKKDNLFCNEYFEEEKTNKVIKKQIKSKYDNFLSLIQKMSIEESIKRGIQDAKEGRVYEIEGFLDEETK